MKLSVPYYSQFVDVADPFWMLRSCGAVCLKSVVEFHGKEVPDIVTLSTEAQERGGYDMENGWVHDYLVSKAKELGCTAYRKEGLSQLTEIISFLDTEGPVIVSVEKRVLEQKRFHMIVLVGYDATKEILYYHESESTNKEKGKYRECSYEVFLSYWRGKAIFVTR